jgi:hypothetical protein
VGVLHKQVYLVLGFYTMANRERMEVVEFKSVSKCRRPINATWTESSEALDTFVGMEKTTLEILVLSSTPYLFYFKYKPLD